MPDCPRCKGRSWICEAHSMLPFEHDDCRGPGDPCPLCNRHRLTMLEKLRRNMAERL